MSSQHHRPKDPILYRLQPLYLMSFFQGYILWYAIEKVYMTTIGFDSASIAFAVVLMNLVMLVFEVPLGILADRWSRKWMLFLSVSSLGLATFIAGIAQSISQYLVSVVFFGLYLASYSGLTEAIVYDTLLEEKKSGNFYEKYYSHVRLYASVSLVIGSLLGGWVAQQYGFQQTYYVSLPSCLFALLFIALLREPTVHKKNQVFLFSHIRQMTAELFKSAHSELLLVATLLFGVISLFFLELDQLWPLALSLPAFWYGPFNALLLFGYGLSGPVASILGKKKFIGALASLVVIVLTVILVIPNIFLIALAEFGILLLSSAFVIILHARLHALVSSSLRSGVLSLLSTLTTLIFMPFSYIFGVVVKDHTVFFASILLVPISLIGGISYVIYNQYRKEVMIHDKTK